MSTKERGEAITAWLSLMLFANVFVIAIYASLAFTGLDALLSIGHFPLWTTDVMMGVGAFNIACVCFLFFWKKWAFYAICGAAAFTLAFNLSIGVGPVAFSGLGMTAITYVVLRTQWNQFDD